MPLKMTETPKRPVLVKACKTIHICSLTDSNMTISIADIGIPEDEISLIGKIPWSILNSGIPIGRKVRPNVYCIASKSWCANDVLIIFLCQVHALIAIGMIEVYSSPIKSRKKFLYGHFFVISLLVSSWQKQRLVRPFWDLIEGNDRCIANETTKEKTFLAVLQICEGRR